MADFSQDAWRIYVAPLPADERRQAMRDLSRGIHRVLNDARQPLSFDAGPTTAMVATPPPNIERKALVPHHRSPATTDAMRRVPETREAPSNGGPPRLSPDDKRGFDAFLKSFEQLPPTERAKATQKLVETYIPRLIHD